MSTQTILFALSAAIAIGVVVNILKSALGFAVVGAGVLLLVVLVVSGTHAPNHLSLVGDKFRCAAAPVFLAGARLCLAGSRFCLAAARLCHADAGANQSLTAVLTSARRPAQFVLGVMSFQSLIVSIMTVTAIAIGLQLALLLALSTMLVVLGIAKSLITTGIKAGIDGVDYAARLATTVTWVWRGGMAQLGINAFWGLRLSAVTRRPYRPWARPYTLRAGLLACSEAAWCQTLGAAVTLWLSGVADPFGNVTELGDDGDGLAHDADYVTDVLIAALKTMACLCRRADADKAANRARRVWQQDPANFRKARILAAKDCASMAAKEDYYRCAMDVVYLTCATPLSAPRAAPFAVNNRPPSWGRPAWSFMRFTIRPRVNALPSDVRKKLLKAAHEA